MKRKTPLYKVINAKVEAKLQENEEKDYHEAFEEAWEEVCGSPLPVLVSHTPRELVEICKLLEEVYGDNCPIPLSVVREMRALAEAKAEEQGEDPLPPSVLQELRDLIEAAAKRAQ